MRKSIRISALALMTAAVLGGSATSAAAYGGENGDAPQTNICGNVSQAAEAEEGLGQASEQENGRHVTFCQNGVVNTIHNINPDIYVNLPDEFWQNAN